LILNTEIGLKCDQPDGTSDKTFTSDTGGMGFETPSRSNLPHVGNNSLLLQPWCVGPGAMLRR